MPTYTDPSTGKRIRSEEPLSDSELDEAFGEKPDPGSALSRAADYVAGKTEDWMNAGQNVIGDVYGAATGQKMFPGERTNWQRAGDAATALGPILGPEMSLAGTVAGAGARAYGTDQDTADQINAGTQLLTGGVQAARGAGGLASRTAARFKGVADTMAQRGTLLHAASPEGKTLFWALADALRGSANGAEKTAAQGVMDMLANGTSPTYGDLDKALLQVAPLGKDSAVAGVLRSARDAMTQGTPEARELGRGYFWSGASRLRLPGNLASRGLSGASGLGAATFEARRGNYGRAALYGAAGLTGAGASVGHALAAAGPAARTAAALSGPAIQSLGGGEEATAPEQGDVPPDVPAVTPNPANPSTNVARVSGPFGREINAVAKAVQIPPELLHSVMQQESGGRPGAVSSPASDQVQTRAYGLMQITPGTFKGVEKQVEALLGRPVDLGTPLDNIAASGVLWRNYLDKANGDLAEAARMYHGGENRNYWGAHTEKYAQDILQKFAQEQP